MQGKIIRDLLILLGVFGLIWLIFSLFTYPEDPHILSVGKEEKLGESYLNLILLNPMFGEFENEKVDSMVAIISDRLIKELGLEILTSVDAFVLGEVTGLLTSSSFDRKQEEEADLFAALLLENSSIEPRTLASFFRKLEDETDNELLQHFEIFSTHPNFRSRIREALSYTPEKEFEAEVIELNWDAMKSELK